MTTLTQDEPTRFRVLDCLRVALAGRIMSRILGVGLCSFVATILLAFFCALRLIGTASVKTTFLSNSKGHVHDSPVTGQDRSFPLNDVFRVTDYSFGWRQDSYYDPRFPGDTPLSPQIPFQIIVQAGWPLLCVSGHRDLTVPSDVNSYHPTTLQSISMPQWMGFQPDHRCYIPWMANVAYFVTDWAIMAAICGFPMFCLMLRRFCRFRRGCCAACGYPLDRNKYRTCPECGWQYKSARTEVLRA